MNIKVGFLEYFIVLIVSVYTCCPLLWSVTDPTTLGADIIVIIVTLIMKTNSYMYFSFLLDLNSSRPQIWCKIEVGMLHVGIFSAT